MTDPASNTEDAERRMFHRLLLGFVEELLRSGEVATVGRSDEEIARDLAASLFEIATNKDIALGVILDHRDDLLRAAARAVAEDDPLIACLLYATWWEHWLNGLVVSAAKRQGLSDQLARHLARSNLGPKLKEVLPGLDVPPLAEEHVKRMMYLADERNGYVHYKWQSRDFDSEERDAADARLKQALGEVPASAEYFTQFEGELFLAGGNERVEELLQLSRQFWPSVDT